ncbi:MAG: membrane-bound ClpP family serine protease [Bacteroidia bacterium]|jgi:membrane-bound ClpP family serine protease
MINNMGSTDRLVRLVLAVVLLVLFFADVISGTIGIIGLVVAGIFVVTSFVRFCPLYWPFGISSAKKKE